MANNGPNHLKEIYYSNMEDFLFMVSYKIDKAKVEESIIKKQQQEYKNKA